MTTSTKQRKQWEKEWKESSFESAQKRLQELLEMLNEESLALDKAMESYEEADVIIRYLSKRLSEAEHKVTTLVKDRNQELSIGIDGSPSEKPFEEIE